MYVKFLYRVGVFAMTLTLALFTLGSPPAHSAAALFSRVELDRMAELADLADNYQQTRVGAWCQ